MPITAEKQGVTVCRHGARHFSTPPGVIRSVGLLEEISSGECFDAPFADEKPLALYGAGNFGHMAADVLNALWMKPAFIADRNAAVVAKDPAWNETPVFKPEDVPDAMKASHQLLVTVATAPYVPIETYLMDLGFKHVLPFYEFSERYRHIHPLSNGWRTEKITATDQAMIANVLQGLEDDASRAHHLQFLAWRRLRQEWTFDGAPIRGADRFFIPEVTSVLRPGEHFLDGGAHHGAVSSAFASLRPDWGAITAFEPDAANRAIASETYANRFSEPARQPRLHAHALAAGTGTGMFHSGLGYASQLSRTGRDEVRLAPLDEMGIRPSFVKLHLEGGELDALKGGQRMLAKHRPIIAATIYHNDDGVWRTPLYLMHTLKDYRFLIRLHSWCGTGAVLYAIPRERSAA